MSRSGGQSADPGISFLGSIKGSLFRRIPTQGEAASLRGRDQIPPTTPSSKLQDFLLAVFLFAVVAGAGAAFVGLFESRRLAEEQQAITAIGSALAHSLETQLTRSLSATYSIRSMVRNDDEWSRSNFDWIAHNLIERTGGIRNLQLAPDGIVSDIYPLQGNEDAIGRDLLINPENRGKTLAAIEAKGPALADAVEVVQRGDSVVGRLTLFVPDGQGRDRFWGFVIVTIPLANLLNATNLDEIASQGYQYQLSRTYTGAGDLEVLASSSETALHHKEFDEAVVLPVSVPGSSWYLKVSPSRDPIYGWLPKIETGLVILGAAVLAILVYFRRQRSLELRRSYQELGNQVEDLWRVEKVVDEVARIVTSTLDINDVYQRFCVELSKLVDCDRIAVYGVDQEAGTMEFKYVFGLRLPEHKEGKVVPLAGTHAEVAIETGETHVWEDTGGFQRFSFDEALFKTGLRAGIITPLVSNGDVYGVLNLRSKRSGVYGHRQQAIVERLAAQIAPAVANAELYRQAKSAEEEVRKLSEEKAAVDELAEIITSTLDIRNVYEEFAQRLRQLVDLDAVLITVMDREAGTLTYKYGYGEPRVRYEAGTIIPLKGTRSESMLKEGRTLVLDDIPADLPYKGDGEAFYSGLRASINAPLVDKGRIFGTLFLRSKKKGAFGPREKAIVERLATQISPAVRNAQLYEESKKVESELRQSEKSATALLESAPEGILVTTELGEIVKANDAALDIFGYTREELLGQPVDMLLPKDFKPGHAVHRESYMSQPEMRHMGAGRDLYGARKDASVVPLEIGLSIVSTESGNVALAFISDISARKKAEEAEHRLAEENSVMAEIGRTISSSLDINEVYDQLGETLRKLIPFDRFGMSLVNLERETASATWALGTDIPGRRSGDEVPFAGSLAGEIVNTRSPIMLNPRSAADLETRYPLLMPAYKSGLRSFLTVPLIYRDIVIGVFQIRSKSQGAYDKRHLELAERVANQIAGAIANSQLFEERKRLAEENSVIAEIGRAISSSLDINEVSDQLGEAIRKLIPFDRFSMGLVDYECGTTSPTWTLGTQVIGRKSGDKVPMEGSLAGEVVRTKSPILLAPESVAELEHQLPLLTVSYDAGLRSFIAVPLTVRDDVIAVLQIRSKEQGIYSQRHLELAARVGNQIAGAISNSQLFAECARSEEAVRDSERKYRTLVNESPDMIFVNRINDFGFVEVNDRACEHYGYSREDFLAMDVFDIGVEPLLREEVRALYDRTPVGQVVEVYGINKRRDGMTFPVHVRLTKLDDECAISNVRDITGQREAEENQRRLSEENSVMAEIGRVISSSLDIDHVYNQLGETIRQLIPFDRLTLTTATSDGDSLRPTWIIGTDVPGRRSGDVFPLAGSLAEKVRSTKAPILLEGDPDSGLAQRFPRLIPNLNAGLRSFLAAPLLNRGAAIGVLQLRSKTKGVYSQRHLELLERIGNQIGGAIANSQLFADRVKAEEALRDSEERYRSLVNFSPDAILVSDKEKFLFANPAAASLYGVRGPDDLVGRRWSDFVHADSQAAVGARVRMIIQGGEAGPMRETKIVRMDGDVRDVEVVGVRIAYQGQEAVQAVVRDITDRKQAENRLRNSLKEKEVLMQEINHRVKNNLQIVISLLNLQSRGIEDTQLRDLLKESQERIKAIALIHEKLYGSEDMANVNFEDYLNSLTKDLRMSHGLESSNITLNVNAAEKSLDIDTAIPCGLIVNELVSNSLKHAFPSNGGGEIGVSMMAVEGRNRLVVKDSGSGFPKGFDIKNTDTLGLKLVNALVDQLGGEIEIHRNGGTEICITFG